MALERLLDPKNDWTEEKMNTYERELKYTLDAKAKIADSKAEGYARGKKIGTLEIAQRMLTMNIPVEVIKAVTNLSDSEITELGSKIDAFAISQAELSE
jgi:predicted transposase/invertase (TIGR01784 family)